MCGRGAAAEDSAVLARRPRLAGARVLAWHAAPADAEGYAHELYAALRLLDSSGAARILVERVPEGEEWTAIRDRLQRASTRTIQDST